MKRAAQSCSQKCSQKHKLLAARAVKSVRQKVLAQKQCFNRSRLCQLARHVIPTSRSTRRGSPTRPRRRAAPSCTSNFVIANLGNINEMYQFSRSSTFIRNRGLRGESSRLLLVKSTAVAYISSFEDFPSIFSPHLSPAVCWCPNARARWLFDFQTRMRAD